MEVTLTKTWLCNPALIDRGVGVGAEVGDGAIRGTGGTERCWRLAALGQLLKDLGDDEEIFLSNGPRLHEWMS